MQTVMLLVATKFVCIVWVYRLPEIKSNSVSVGLHLLEAMSQRASQVPHNTCRPRVAVRGSQRLRIALPLHGERLWVFMSTVTTIRINLQAPLLCQLFVTMNYNGPFHGSVGLGVCVYARVCSFFLSRSFYSIKSIKACG